MSWLATPSMSRAAGRSSAMKEPVASKFLRSQICSSSWRRNSGSSCRRRKCSTISFSSVPSSPIRKPTVSSAMRSRTSGSACSVNRSGGSKRCASASWITRSGIRSPRDAVWRREPPFLGSSDAETSAARILKVAAAGLLAFDRLEQGLEVACPEAAGADTLDDLEEQGRTVGDPLGEHLEEVAAGVPVDEDSELPQLVPRQPKACHSVAHVVVVRRRDVEETQAAVAQRPNGADNVVSSDGDVLDAGSAVEVEKLLDLARPQAWRRLVHREHDP